MIDRIKAALSSPKLNAFISNRVNQGIILFALVLVWLCLAGGFLVLVNRASPGGQAAAGQGPTSVQQQVLVPAVNAPPNPAIQLPCKQPKLTVGQATYTIQELEPGPDGAIDLPASKDNAYWVTGSVGGFVFGLSPLRQNQGLQNDLQPGDPLQVVWADCSEENFVVLNLYPGPVDAAALLQASDYGLRVFVPGKDGFVVNGVRPGALTQPPPAPEEAPGTQVDLEFLETALAPGGASLNVIVAVTNRGSAPLQLNPGDITLAEGEGQPRAPETTEPALPIEIGAGQRVELAMVFANPPGGTGVFRVLDMSMDLYY